MRHSASAEHGPVAHHGPSRLRVCHRVPDPWSTGHQIQERSIPAAPAMPRGREPGGGDRHNDQVRATTLPAASRHVSSRQTALVSSAPLLPAHIATSSATKGGSIKSPITDREQTFPGAGRPFATISPGPAAKSRSTLRPRVGPSPLL